ncbi:hypothetical protein Hanom_Chr09g00804241 [Helianthus anomalus]
MEKIKSQLKDVVESRQSSSSDKVLEEISILRANNNSITNPLEKLIKEWVAQKEHDIAKFARVHEEETKNAQLMRDVISLMKRMHYNVARLAHVDIQELTIPIPKEASQLEVPKIIRKQPSATPTSQTGPSSMGPPPSVSKEDMLKGLNLHLRLLPI